MEQLTPTTRELIFEKVTELEEQKNLLEKAIELAGVQNTERFVQFHNIEIDNLSGHIKRLKDILFNNEFKEIN